MSCDVTLSEIQLFGLFILCSPCHLPRVFAPTSTVLVRIETSTVYFTSSLNMEKILQNIVKIIIVGILYEAEVSCTRRYLPPLPFYQNDPYFVPGFITPYQEYVPIYIQPNIPPPPPPPISYQNTNSYTRQSPPRNNNYHPPQLFYKNENYHPLPPPGVNYPVTPFPSHPHSYKAPYTAQQKVNYEISQKPNLEETKPSQAKQQKVQVYSSNIILKDEAYPPYYQDEYNKNYHEDDYTDNYTDDTPVQNDPCMMDTPYRNFEPGPAPYHPNGQDKYTLCNPYFQPNFGNSVYTVKAPITLLPSRFPPRVEEFVQRIQNYFSTYTEKETPKPENQTSTTVPPTNETSAVLSSTNEISAPVSSTNKAPSENQTPVENIIKTNATEIQQLEQSPLTNQGNETQKVTVELEFVGKKTPTDVLKSKMETIKAEEVFTTTEEPSTVLESTVKSQIFVGESSTPEVMSTVKSLPENSTEVYKDTTPTNEVLLEVTDTNG